MLPMNLSLLQEFETNYPIATFIFWNIQAQNEAK
jgi:hypothetical protein